MLIHTGGIGKCKSNYCTITAKMVKPRILEDGKDLSTIFIPMPILNVFYDKFCARKISMHLLQTWNKMYNKNVSDCPKLKSENIVSGNIFSKIWKKQVFEK